MTPDPSSEIELPVTSRRKSLHRRRIEKVCAAHASKSPTLATWLVRLSQAGADVRAVFNAPGTTFRERKQLLRAILTEVAVTVDATAGTAAMAIIWQGGARTELTMTMTKTGGHFQTTSEGCGEGDPGADGREAQRPRGADSDH